MRIKFEETNIFFTPNNKLQLLVYPNPALGNVNISGNFNGTAILKIYNASGQIVYENKNASNQEIINVRSFTAGMYIYQVVTADHRQKSGKLIIFH